MRGRNVQRQGRLAPKGKAPPAWPLQQVERLGGKTIQPPVQVPGGVKFALFADPEGHVVGLVKD